MYANTRGEGFGAEVRRWLLIGTHVLSAGYRDAYYDKARKVRTLIAGDFAAAFETCDVILTPTTPGTAFGLDEKRDDPLTMYFNDAHRPLYGFPHFLPVGLGADGTPLGLQLIGGPRRGNAFQRRRRLGRAAASTSRRRWQGCPGDDLAIQGETGDGKW